MWRSHTLTPAWRAAQAALRFWKRGFKCRSPYSLVAGQLVPIVPGGGGGDGGWGGAEGKVWFGARGGCGASGGRGGGEGEGLTPPGGGDCGGCPGGGYVWFCVENPQKKL